MKILFRLSVLTCLLAVASTSYALNYDVDSCSQKMDEIKWVGPSDETPKSLMRFDFLAVGRDVNLLFNENLVPYKQSLNDTLGNKKYWTGIGLCAGKQLWTKRGNTSELLKGFALFATFSVIDAYTAGYGSSVLKMMLSEQNQMGPSEFDVLYKALASHIDSRLIQERAVEFMTFYDTIQDKLYRFRRLDVSGPCLETRECTTYHHQISLVTNDLLEALNSVVFGGDNYAYFQDTIYQSPEFRNEIWKYAPIYLHLVSELMIVDKIGEEVGLYKKGTISTINHKHLTRLSGLIRSYYAGKEKLWIAEHTAGGYTSDEYVSFRRKLDEEFPSVFGMSVYEVNNLMKLWAETLNLNASDYRVCNFQVDQYYMAWGCPKYDKPAHYVFRFFDAMKTLGSFADVSGKSQAAIDSLLGTNEYLNLQVNLKQNGFFGADGHYENQYYNWLNSNVSFSKRSDNAVFRESLKKIINESHDEKEILRKLFRYELQRLLREASYDATEAEFFEWLDRMQDEYGRAQSVPVLVQIKQDIVKRKKEKEQAALTVIINSLLLH